MKGLLALIGKPKASGDEPDADDMPMGDSGGGLERDYAREAFSALKDDDEEGFVSAFLGAVKACVKKSSAGGYEDDEATEE